MSTHKKTGGTNATKDVIYIDVDDEITAIIDKVAASKQKIVALVLPKRAAVLQSIVNMKLLKRAAGDAKKNLVLITSEHGLLPLAGSVGIHVAKSLNSRPEIPDVPGRTDDKAEDAEAEEVADTEIDASRTVGELSGGAHGRDDDEEPIELDNDDDKPADGDEPASKDGEPKAKKFKIPNFNKFRLVLLLAGVGVIVLGMVVYAAAAVWPKASITIQTDSQSVDSSLTLTFKVAADATLDTENGVVPAQIQEVKKTLTQEAPATGQKNNGEKAKGSIVMRATDCTQPYSVSDVPAGSGVSSGGNTYITQGKATFNLDDVDDGCAVFVSGSVSIVAQTGGEKFNVASGSAFTVAGRSGVTATGSASGGTDKITKVVSQADIDGAKQKITQQDTTPIRQELEQALIGRGLFPVAATFTESEPETKVSAEANTEAETVVVTQVITYTMRGVQQQDLEQVIAADVGKKIDTTKQSILSYGLNSAYFSIQGMSGDDMQIAMRASAVAGAALNADDIKKEVAGKKAGDAKALISAHPGVTNVTVEYSPFWVSSIPKKTDKITVVIEEPKVAADDADESP